MKAPNTGDLITQWMKFNLFYIAIRRNWNVRRSTRLKGHAMKQDEGYVFLGRDLDDLVSCFNPTEAQQAAYPRPSGRGKQITRTMFGKEDQGRKPCLRWLAEDGGDGEPVGSQSPRAASAFWDYGKGHIYPTQRDLVRIGRFFRLDFYRTLGFCLKGAWEFFVGKSLGWVVNGPSSLSETLVSYKIQDPHRKAAFLKSHAVGTSPGYPALRKQFKEEELAPLARELFTLFETHEGWATEAGYTEETLGHLLADMVEHDLQRRANKSAELHWFARRWGAQQEKLRQGGQEERESFWADKMKWFGLQEETTDLLLQIADRHTYRMNMRFRFLGVFGREYETLEESLSRRVILREKIALAEAAPDKSRDQIESSVKDREGEELENLEALRLTVAWARQPLPEGEFKTASTEELHALQDRRKKLLRDLFFTLFPPFLEKHPKWPVLTEAQKVKLRELWEEVIEIRDKGNHVQNPRLYAFYHFSELELLKAQAKAKTILELAGLDFQAQLVVPGDLMLKEQLTWLHQQIELLERGLDRLREELLTLLSDAELAYWEEVLPAPERYEEVRAELQEEIGAVQEEVEILACEWESRWAPVAEGSREGA